MLVLFIATAVAFNWPTIRNPHEPRPLPPPSVERHPDVLIGNDIEAFAEHLERAAEGVGRGELYLPISNFDCPITFLLPCGIVRHATGWPPVAVMNGFVFMVVVLNGFFAFGFLREIGTDPRLAAVLALAYQGSNFVAYCSAMGHMNNIQIGWIAASFWATARLCREGSGWGSVLFLGAAMGLQMLSSPAFTLYMAFAGLPAFCLGYWWVAIRRVGVPGRAAARFMGKGLVAAVVAGLVAAFYLVPRLQQPPRIFPPPTWLPYVFDNYQELIDPTHPTLFLGLVVFILAILAVNWWWSNRTPYATACLLAAVTGLVMMAPAVPGSPYWVFYQLVPPFRHLRVPTRFFPIAYLAALGLIGLYLTSVGARLTARSRGLLAVALLLALVVLYWLTSPWYFPVDPVAAMKAMLGKE